MLPEQLTGRMALVKTSSKSPTIQRGLNLAVSRFQVVLCDAEGQYAALDM